MSDSLFLDPFAEPPDREAADPLAPAGGRSDLSRPGDRGRGRTDPEGQLTEPLTAVIALEADQAVEAFLEYVHLWWPSAVRACGEDSHLGFEDGMLLEEGVVGDGHRWADVVGIDGAALSLRWFGRPGREAAESGRQAGAEVTIGFAAGSAGHTRVTVRGTGPTSWAEDWSCALEAYSRFTGGDEAAKASERSAG